MWPDILSIRRMIQHGRPFSVVSKVVNINHILDARRQIRLLPSMPARWMGDTLMCIGQQERKVVASLSAEVNV